MKFYCDMCGREFDAKTWTAKYCPECRKRRKEKPMVECQACGKIFRKTSGNVRYCPQCRAKRAEHKSVKCEMCGKVFVKKNRSLYCPECRKRRKEKPMVECQECGKFFKKTSGNVSYCPECRANWRRKKEPAKKRAPVLTLAQVCELAREAGLSYGQYVVRMEQISGIRR